MCIYMFLFLVRVDFLKFWKSIWVAQLVEHAILDLKVMTSSPTLGVEPTLKKLLKKEKLWKVHQIVSNWYSFFFFFFP